ncbi:uncharacterized protein LOC131669771 isoform X1 [Phymastichus coffea]|uniref:uncharacterized protein LOC131669771 isoform X1 n=1 Tax=Phymastichus coffea TaxID=108790 RepID=UPI00273A83E0|nr:uncharacterized protein LOC131669771 isoform X1 [Phymastichus coffea]XP_058802050.1 uncharacterized protein LOC131669771 isoform X1 [Phymastichus coffea]
MTVLPSVSDVADKAVSTEDVKGGGGGGGGAELARLEAVLSALVEGKLEALRAGAGRSAGRPRRPSSSSLSSSQPRDPRRPAPAGVRAARHACCSAAQPRAACDADEQLALGFADEPCGPEDGTGLAGLEAGFRQSAGRPQKPRGGRRGRRRRGRRPRAARLVDVEADELELGSVMVDPDDLPPRARWTIMATACLLLAMSLLLVGVTLRMAPIIDEMGDGRRASACKRKSSSGSGGRRASSAAAAAAHYRRDSVRPDNSRSPSTAGGLEAALKDPREEARTRRHRLVALVLLAIFAFILLAAVLAVVITLTHSSFHVPPIGSRELAEHRANDAVDPSNATFSARRTKNY